MATQIRFRRGTTAQHATFVGAAGEVTVDTDKKTVVVHDGVTPGGQPLPTTNPISDVVRFDSAQTLTLSQRGQARANIGAGVLTGFRNKIINGDFDVWQRGTSQTTTGYGSDDRWLNSFVGGSLTHSRQAFSIGQAEVPGAPTWFSRSVVTHAVGTSNFHNKTQAIENVQTLGGQKATFTFYAKADVPKNIAIELTQFFGTGGSPSAQVTGIGSRLVALTASWQKFTFTVDIPSVTGKVLGTNGNDYLGLTFWFEAGANFNSRTANLGQQSGTFDIAHVSFVEGDATAEENPFSALHPQQVLALCQRYFERTPRYYFQYTSLASIITSNPVHFKVRKRASPTIVAVFASSINTLTPYSVQPNVDGFNISSLADANAGSVRVIEYEANADAEL